MVITEVPQNTATDKTLTCVELDSTSWFVDFKTFISAESVTEEIIHNPFDMIDVLYKAESLNKGQGVQNGFLWKDEMLSKTSVGLRNFIFPQKDLFGFCDNFKSTTFLLDIDPDLQGTCV